MSRAKTWREGEIEAITRKIAEKMFDEKIKVVKTRVDELEKAIWKLEDLYDVIVDGK